MLTLARFPSDLELWGPIVCHGLPENTAAVCWGSMGELYKSVVDSCSLLVKVLSLTPPTTFYHLKKQFSSSFPQLPPPDISPLTQRNCLNRKRMRWGGQKYIKKTPDVTPVPWCLKNCCSAPCWSCLEEVTLSPPPPLCGQGGLILTRGLSGRWTAESYIKNSWQLQQVKNSSQEIHTSKKTSIELLRYFLFFFNLTNTINRAAALNGSLYVSLTYILSDWFSGLRHCTLG